MKKLVTAFALCATMSAMAVDSANIVGYSTQALTSGYNMVGVNFEKVGSGGADLNTMTFTGLAEVNYETTTGGDQLLIWDPAAQGYPTTYSWCGPNADASMSTTGMNNKWIDFATFDGETVPVVTVPVSGAAWILRTTVGSASATFAGQVKTSASTISLFEGYNMVANSMPTSVNLNDVAKLTYTSLVEVNYETTTGGDQLLIWDAAVQGYPTTYSWCGPNADASMSTTGMNNKWIDFATFDGETVPVVTLPVNGAAWLLHTSSDAASVNVSAL